MEVRAIWRLLFKAHASPLTSQFGKHIRNIHEPSLLRTPCLKPGAILESDAVTSSGIRNAFGRGNQSCVQNDIKQAKEEKEMILTSLAALGSETQAKVMSQVETTSAGVRPNRAPSWMNKSHCKRPKCKQQETAGQERPPWPLLY